MDLLFYQNRFRSHSVSQNKGLAKARDSTDTPLWYLTTWGCKAKRCLAAVKSMWNWEFGLWSCRAQRSQQDQQLVLLGLLLLQCCCWIFIANNKQVSSNTVRLRSIGMWLHRGGCVSALQGCGCYGNMPVIPAEKGKVMTDGSRTISSLARCLFLVTFIPSFQNYFLSGGLGNNLYVQLFWVPPTNY